MAVSISAEREEILCGTETFADRGVSLIGKRFGTHKLQIRKHAPVIERRRRNEITVVRKHNQPDRIARPVIDKVRGAGFDGVHSGSIAELQIHALRKIQHDHDLQAPAFDAVEDEGIDRTE